MRNGKDYYFCFFLFLFSLFSTIFSLFPLYSLICLSAFPFPSFSILSCCANFSLLIFAFFFNLVFLPCYLSFLSLFSFRVLSSFCQPFSFVFFSGSFVCSLLIFIVFIIYNIYFFFFLSFLFFPSSSYFYCMFLSLIST